MTNWENGVRTPFIIRTPGAKPGRTRHLAEAVDMYRTLADVVGLHDAVEASVDGVSLLPLLLDPLTTTPPRTAAQSQFPRCYSALSPYIPGGRNASSIPGQGLPQLDQTDCQSIPRDRFDLMGYSLRTAGYRITEYRVWDGAKLEGRWDLPPNATELYDHTKDDPNGDVMATEADNVAAVPAMASVLAAMSAKLRQRFAPELNTPEHSTPEPSTPQTLAPAPAATCNEVSTSLGSHMVLQRSPESAVIYGSICGKLNGAKNISVTVDGGEPTVVSIAPGSRSWEVKLPPQVGGLKSHAIKISGGSFTRTLEDVLFGDVILCSGQVRVIRHGPCVQ